MLAATFRAPLSERSFRYSMIRSRSENASGVYRTLIVRGVCRPLPPPHRKRTRPDPLERFLWPRKFARRPTSYRCRYGGFDLARILGKLLLILTGPGRRMFHHILEGLRRHITII